MHSLSTYSVNNRASTSYYLAMLSARSRTLRYRRWFGWLWTKHWFTVGKSGYDNCTVWFGTKHNQFIELLGRTKFDIELNPIYAAKVRIVWPNLMTFQCCFTTVSIRIDQLNWSLQWLLFRALPCPFAIDWSMMEQPLIPLYPTQATAQLEISISLGFMHPFENIQRIVKGTVPTLIV